MRFKLFLETLKQIDAHNEKFAKGQVEVQAGLNEYSDWTDEEKTKLLQWTMNKLCAVIKFLQYIYRRQKAVETFT